MIWKKIRLLFNLYYLLAIMWTGIMVMEFLKGDTSAWIYTITVSLWWSMAIGVSVSDYHEKEDEEKIKGNKNKGRLNYRRLNEWFY